MDARGFDKIARALNGITTPNGGITPRPEEGESFRFVSVTGRRVRVLNALADAGLLSISRGGPTNAGLSGDPILEPYIMCDDCDGVPTITFRDLNYR